LTAHHLGCDVRGGAESVDPEAPRVAPMCKMRSPISPAHINGAASTGQIGEDTAKQQKCRWKEI
jgi:hypothetical protein